MGRWRAPCCVKIGLNKGSWTPEEDMRLIAYIHKYGHGNWRALPKLAGLSRCGKSCRLRWINYLRPDIKRGNFSKEEEDTIIKLHGLLGNKWSKIASCLPGRTDNEIKNVWNTHLKKRVQPKEQKPSASPQRKPEESPCSSSSITAASTSWSESESKSDKNLVTNMSPDEEIDKIEFPIEPNLDLWDDIMLQDSSLSEQPQDPQNVSPCASSNAGVLIDIPEITIEPSEIWDMIDSDIDTAAATTSNERGNWLEYLEKELDLFEESNTSNYERGAYNFAEVEVGDPVASYFQGIQSSSTSLDSYIYIDQ